MSSLRSSINRRRFLKAAGALSAFSGRGFGAYPGVSIVVDPSDAVANSGPAKWAAQELGRSLKLAGSTVEFCASVAAAKKGNQCIVAAGADTAIARELQTRAGVTVAEAPEALALVPASTALLASGHDSRGLVYALLDLTDRVQNGVALVPAKAITEKPFNKTRSMTRLFTSDVEDKPWFNDREMWPQYLTMLAANRFNRFNLALGIGYDFVRQVTDAYFLFEYPFLMAVPGYNVRAVNLPDSERDANLEMLRFIAKETVARGLEFQLGIWMHAYEWINTQHANYTIEGLNRENHGPYCRDAIRALLQAVPEISGVTLRIHGESGVEEGSYDFWKLVFEGVRTCGRRVEIDMHAKGMDETMQNLALATGLPVRISPKYWAEHLGMPYHQADIRDQERPKPGKDATGLMKLSAGSRSFLRYGYGDLLREDRRWGVLHRIWPGTQRLLLWGDPEAAAAHSRAFAFCGSDGVEIMEPLSFKGRRGSGIQGDRCGYLDATLKPRWDWQKYEYGTRVWGRALYNPDADPSAWRPWLKTQFGPGSEAVEKALAQASRILPLITTAHAPSAGNNMYWPEVYLNQSLTDAAHPGPYTDSNAPRVFGNASPLDPQLFASMYEFADSLVKKQPDARYTPAEVATWLEDYAANATEQLKKAESLSTGKARAQYRRMAIDVTLQAGLGRFFAARFRSGVLYGIFEQTGSREALEASIQKYKDARAAWAGLAAVAKPVYVADLTVGENPQLRGHWADRLPAIDADIALTEKKLDGAKSDGGAQRAAIAAALAVAHRKAVPCAHNPVATFHAGQSVPLSVSMKGAAGMKLYYRHVTQAERWISVDMEKRDGVFTAAIPASYTTSAYPLEYYFEVRQGETASLYPGFHGEAMNQPYFVVRKA